MKKSFFIDVTRTAVLAVVYLGAALFGLSFEPVSGFATLVWPPTGIALAALVLFGYRLSPGIAIGAFLANLITGAPPLVAVGIAIGNTLEAVIGAYLLQKIGFQHSLERLKDVVHLIFRGALLSTIVSATIGVTMLWLGGITPFQKLASTWSAWWIGDMLGDLIVAPLIFLWLRQRFRDASQRMQWQHTLEIIGLFSLLVFTSLTIFWNLFDIEMHSSTVYFVFLPLLWAALRFNPRVAITAIAALSAIAIIGTTAGYGPFTAAAGISQNLLLLQLFMGVASITIMILAATASERKKTMHQLHIKLHELANEKARDERIIDSIGEGLVVTDQQGNIILVNKVFENLLGWNGEEIKGKSFFEVVPREDEKGNTIPVKKRLLQRALMGDKVMMNGHNMSFHLPPSYYIRKDKTKFPVVGVVTPILVEGNIIGAIEVFHDVTKEIEFEKIEHEFITITSHQLRTPLTTINWVMERFLKTERLTKHGREYLNEVVLAARNLSELIVLLLNVSRFEGGKIRVLPQKMNVITFINSYLQEMEPLSQRKHLDIAFQRHPTQLTVLTDPMLFRNIVQSLLSNAIEYTPDGGRISVILEKDNNCFRFIVQDTGIGIPESDKSLIFGRFFRASNAFLVKPGGTGLGLYFVKHATRLLGGKTWFTSKENEGSSFFVELPLESKSKEGGNIIID